MGGSCTKETDPLNNTINEELLRDKTQFEKVHKLLLLGPGNAGKTTFFKQLKILHDNETTEKERKLARPDVTDSIINQMKKLIDKCKDLHDIDDIPKDIQEIMTKVSKQHQGVKFGKKLGDDLKTLWNTEHIQRTYKERTNLGIVDSCDHFFNDLDRICDKNYIPTEKDILLARTPTTGIHEQRYTYEDNKFEIYDIGGQRSERGKWIHCFDSVNAILFVVSLSCYDQFLYEDKNINGMDESLELWDEIVNSHYFENRRISMIIFFNKYDLFEKKIQTSSLKKWDKDYEGEDGNIKDALNHIRKKFLDLCENDKRQIYTHPTCAIDKENVKKLFNDVQHTIVLGALTRNGIL